MAPSKPVHSPDVSRVSSLDAYRGFVMFLMLAEVLSFCEVSAALPASGFWKFLCRHQSHVEWVGCSLHDLIQPSFTFLVGVVLPFSIAARTARGQSRWRMTGHAAWRAGLLVLLGVFLRSVGMKETNWTFEDTLSQIGLGYFFVFLLGWRPVREQWGALILILAGYWMLFALYPQPGPNFDYPSAGVAADWPHLFNGWAAHWNKNSNVAWAFDTWFLNLFPRESAFRFNEGGYATLSFIPTLGTMILGLIAGDILKSARKPLDKVRWFVIAGFIGLVTGSALNWLGVCPVVKRIWTPSWVLFSGGWCFLLLAGFYLVMDVWQRRVWAFPLVIVGMNSIAAYCLAHLCENFVSRTLETHLGRDVFECFGEAYAPLLHGAAVLLVLWLMLFWLHRRKIYLRI